MDDTLTSKLKALRALCDQVTNAVSDDFGHDCQKLLEWESDKAQEFAGDLVPRLIEALELAAEQRDAMADELVGGAASDYTDDLDADRARVLSGNKADT